jgi:pimeloyl-ACP methyl ester carboxylesterase
MGPPAVPEGTPDGPIVLVLDPSGAAKHDELPATWRDFAREWHVLWSRVPADPGLTRPEEYLTAPDRAVTLVASGASADDALGLAEKHPTAVRAVLLVDPGTDRYVAPERGEAETGHWEDATASRRKSLEEQGVTVETVALSTGGERDRVPAPVPLGHPDVAEAVRKAIEE